MTLEAEAAADATPQERALDLTDQGLRDPRWIAGRAWTA